MRITFDPAKREWTIAHRGLDFLDATVVFAGKTAERQDDRRDYGEVRWITAGWLRDSFVLIAWTPRGEARRIISMRYGHDKEAERWNPSGG